MPSRPVRPSGILRDECQLLADAAGTLGARMTQSGYILDVRFRFSSPSQGPVVDVAMAGRFDYGRDTFSVDGSAENIVLPIAGPVLSASGRGRAPRRQHRSRGPRSSFSGLIRITTSTLRPETCICQAWFEYQAIRSTNASICP